LRVDRSARRWKAAARLATLSTALWMAGGAVLRAEGTLTVSAAISLTESLEAIARAYAKDGGEAVRFNFAGSNALSRQIINGAPVDLFISADDAQMDVAARAGAIDVTTRVLLLGNRLAVVTLPGGPAIADIRGLLQASIRRIAIGDPAAVPAGLYAREYLERAGIWEALGPKVVPVANVRAALAAVENGSAEAAITYQTDAAAARRARAVLIVSGADAPRIVYPAAIVSVAPNRRGAERLLSYLRGSAAAEIFTQYGFVPLPRGR
jgi:molybdate transport system substrate-binding protein